MTNKWDPVVGTKPYNKNMERINQLAENKGYLLNPDEERIKKVDCNRLFRRKSKEEKWDNIKNHMLKKR